ncbi:MAG: hypothetical protein E5Y10_22785 [Mesorhizobium sp.]|uniref:hypothetical protein n=1 Tax=Mesorhizobium sp. TaxID=1871066 RepID=UPI0011FDD3B1|nr:hypothetical protein [Mesorhizobium sp.]TIN41371.1 MAG: hypothetical protein E5Y13_05640 [Mesorhizobium sp.]TJU86149.1 MAG: hypothetical protein E5Y10_22785 [Mesorhizobium sp.]
MSVDTVAWIELREPNCVPQLKGSFKLAAISSILREFMDARPKAFITVITIDCYGRPLLQDGPEALMMADGRSRARARRHIETSRTAFADSSKLSAALKEADGFRMRADGTYFKPGS